MSHKPPGHLNTAYRIPVMPVCVISCSAVKFRNSAEIHCSQNPLRHNRLELQPGCTRFGKANCVLNNTRDAVKNKMLKKLVINTKQQLTIVKTLKTTSLHTQ